MICSDRARFDAQKLIDKQDLQRPIYRTTL